MKALLTTFKKDMKLSLRSFYIYLVLLFAILFVVIMLFAVNDETELSSPFVIYVEDQEELKDFSSALSEDAQGSAIVVNSREELIASLEDDYTLKGLYVNYENDKVNIEFVQQGYEDDSISKMLEAEMLGKARSDMGLTIDKEVTLLRENAEKVPLKGLLIPIFLVMESALMGMLLVAAYVFMEKQEGSIRAYSVSPGKVWHYLASKILMFLVFGLLSALFVVFTLRGFDFNFLQVLLLTIVFNIFGTLLGLIISVFFDSLQGAMVWIVVIAAVIGVSTVSYINPSFSPRVVTLMPTYPMQFAFKEALFPAGDTAYVWNNILGFSAVNIILFFFGTWLYKKRISTF